ncbi:MAG: hypothetical protein ACON35_07160 [Candidatus Marinamargulisbacteria bacterium]
MNILITLKQKDLDAVSAQQLLANYGPSSIEITTIQRYENYEISGSYNQQLLLKHIENSHVFANPNKHHLIQNLTNFNNDQLIFNVSRKSPLNLESKVSVLNQLLGNNSITSVTMSELWSISFSKKILDQNELMSTILTSSSNNSAPFAHPLIHNVDILSLQELSQKLQLPTTSVSA